MSGAGVRCRSVVGEKTHCVNEVHRNQKQQLFPMWQLRGAKVLSSLSPLLSSVFPKQSETASVLQPFSPLLFSFLCLISASWLPSFPAAESGLPSVTASSPSLNPVPSSPPLPSPEYSGFGNALPSPCLADKQSGVWQIICPLYFFGGGDLHLLGE